MEIRFHPIGTIHSPFTTLENMPIQPSGAEDVTGNIVLDPRFEEGLSDLEGFSHIILLYYFHRCQGYRLSVTPFLDTVERGLFSTRAPRRPNPIGLSIVKLLGIEGHVLAIQGVDVLDGTPLLDIKPWVPSFDVRENARSGWLEKSKRDSRTTTSDDRFVQDNEPTNR